MTFAQAEAGASGYSFYFSTVDLTYYQRYLPHQLGAGQAYFITFRLAGSLPLEALARLREEHILLEREAAAHRAAGHPDKPYNRQKR